MVPEAIAFSFVAGVEPLVGLYAAFIMVLITSIFGGRPGMISGATGALAVVMVALVATHGVEYLFAAVVLMGILQLGFGALRLGKFIRLVPHPVMLGFVNGLAIVIFLSQLESFKVGEAWLSGARLWTMLGLTVVAVFLILWLPKLNKNIPAPLVAIAAVAGAAAVFGLDARTVADLSPINGGFPLPHIPMVPFNFETLRIIFPYSLILAAVGLIETLLTLNLIDEVTDTVGRPNKESLAQGAGNIVTGFFGGMGGCAMIGQSMINVDNGGTRRLSGVVAATGLIAGILFLGDIIGQIPLSALVGLMVVVSAKTFAWASLTRLNKVPKEDAFVIIAVTVVTVLTDLATAVVIGVAIAGLVFSWKHAKHIRIDIRDGPEGRVYEVHGTVFFASTQQFAAGFNPKDDPDHVVIEFRHARVMDHSAIEAIEALATRYEKHGKTLRLRHLSADCRALMDRAKSHVDIDPEHDPRYHPAVDHLAERLAAPPPRILESGRLPTGMDLELVSFKICPYVQRSRITLLHKGIEHKVTYIDLADPPEWFQEKSPLGKVPIMIVNGLDVLFESAVINEFVDEVTPGQLMPVDPIQRAQTRAWIEFGSNCLVDFYQAAMAPDEETHLAKLQDLNAKLARLDDQVKGPFFWGEFSIADAALAPLLMRLDWFENRAEGFTLDAFPKLTAWRKQLLAMDAVQQSIVPDWRELQDEYVAKTGGFIGNRITAA